jgi:hypothetical protein
MSKYVDEPDVDQVMGRRGRDTDEEDSDSGDEMDFRKQRQQLKQQQQQQQQQQRASNVPLAGLLAAENDEIGEDECISPMHAHTAALCEACRAGDVEALKRLLAAPGARAGAANAEGESPLHVAARAGHPACVQQLAAASVDLNPQSAQQATPALQQPPYSLPHLRCTCVALCTHTHTARLPCIAALILCRTVPHLCCWQRAATPTG